MWKLLQTGGLPELLKEPLHLLCSFIPELNFLAVRRKIIKICSLHSRQIEFVPCHTNSAYYFIGAVFCFFFKMKTEIHRRSNGFLCCSIGCKSTNQQEKYERPYYKIRIETTFMQIW